MCRGAGTVDHDLTNQISTMMPLLNLPKRGMIESSILY